MRVRREWAWVPILIAVLALLLFGCGTIKESSERNAQIRIRVEDRFEARVTEVEYKGHTYLVHQGWHEEAIVHAGHCKGDHQ